jgi:hypothetical protein
MRKVVGDFRGWEGSTKKYENAFQKFLAALEASDKNMSRTKKEVAKPPELSWPSSSDDVR